MQFVNLVDQLHKGILRGPLHPSGDFRVADYRAYPPRFAAWLAIRFRGPVCDRWRSFVNFYLDVGPRPS
jgi:hypothetical protein